MEKKQIAKGIRKLQDAGADMNDTKWGDAAGAILDELLVWLETGEITPYLQEWIDK